MGNMEMETGSFGVQQVRWRQVTRHVDDMSCWWHVMLVTCRWHVMLLPCHVSDMSCWWHVGDMLVACCRPSTEDGGWRGRRSASWLEERGRVRESRKYFRIFHKNISDQKIIFGGTSAGGRGSMVLVDFLHDHLHDSTIVYGLHDSGAYQGEYCIKCYI